MNNQDIDYKKLKYKSKYLNLKRSQQGGCDPEGCYLLSECHTDSQMTDVINQESGARGNFTGQLVIEIPGGTNVTINIRPSRRLGGYCIENVTQFNYLALYAYNQKRQIGTYYVN